MFEYVAGEVGQLRRIRSSGMLIISLQSSRRSEPIRGYYNLVALDPTGTLCCTTRRNCKTFMSHQSQGYDRCSDTE